MAELIDLDECLTEAPDNIIDHNDSVSVVSGELDIEVTEPKIKQLPKGALKLVENDDLPEDDIVDLDNESVVSDNPIPKPLRKKEKITKEDIEIHEILESKQKQKRIVEQVKQELDDPELNESRASIVSKLRQYLEDPHIKKVVDLSIIPEEYDALPYESLVRIHDTIRNQLGMGATTRMYRQMADLLPSGIELGFNKTFEGSGISIRGFAQLLSGNIRYQASVSEYIIESSTESYSDPMSRIAMDMGMAAVQAAAASALGIGDTFKEVTPEAAKQEFESMLKEPIV